MMVPYSKINLTKSVDICIFNTGNPEETYEGQNTKLHGGFV